MTEINHHHEIAHHVHGFWDRPLSGVANYGNTPHIFINDETFYYLRTVPAAMMEDIFESIAIWERYLTAIQENTAQEGEIENECLDADREKHLELKVSLQGIYNLNAGNTADIVATFPMSGTKFFYAPGASSTKPDTVVWQYR